MPRIGTGRFVAQATGRELTRQDMGGILLAAGYTDGSANGRMSSSPLLFHRTGPDRYRLITRSEPRTLMAIISRALAR